MLMTFAEYAKSVDKSKVYIHKLYKQGRLNNALVKHPNTGKIMVNKKIADGILSGSKLNAEEFNSKNKHDEEFLTLSYDEARRMKTYYEGKMEHIKYDKELGKLIPIEKVRKEAYRTGLIYRDKILSIPTQVAALLVGMTSIFEIKNILTEYITNTLNEFSNLNFIIDHTEIEEDK